MNEEYMQWLLSNQRPFTPQPFPQSGSWNMPTTTYNPNPIVEQPVSQPFYAYPPPIQSAGNTPYRMPYDPSQAVADPETGMLQAPARPKTEMVSTPITPMGVTTTGEMTANTDIPITVPQQAQSAQQQNVQGFNLMDLFAPVSTETAVFKLGQSLAFDPTNATKSQRTGNTLRGIGAGGKAALSLLRTGLQGAAYQNRWNEAMNTYNTQQGQQDFRYFQDGGQMTQEQLMSGDYIGETSFQPTPNAEIEKNEYVQYPDGTTVQAVGPTHEQGGIPVNLPQDTKVVSDNMKIGGKTARELRKEFDLNVKANDTFADAITKYKKKIGLQKIDEQQQDLFKKLGKQDNVEDAQTSAINETFIAKEIQTSQMAKEPLLQQLSAFTDMMFEKQEELKGNKSQDNFLQNGGYAQINENDLATINAATGDQIQFTLEGAQQLFGKALPDNTTNAQSVAGKNQTQQRPNFNNIVDITSGTNRYTPDGGVIVGNYRQVWLNNRPEYYTGKTPPQENKDFVYMNEKQYADFKNTQEYKNYKSQTQPIASLENGGKLPKYQNGVRVSNRFEDPNKFTYQQAVGTGYYGDVLTNSAQDVLGEIKRLHPELYTQYFTGNNILPTDTKGFQSAINAKYQAIAEDAKTVYGENSEQYKAIVAQMEQDKFLDDASVRGTEGKFGNYSSTRPNFALNILPKEELEKVNKEGVNTASQLAAKFPDLHKKYIQDKGLKSDFWLGSLEAPTQPTTSANNDKFEDGTVDAPATPVSATPNIAGGYLNLVDQTLPPPSGLVASRMPDADYRNYEAVQQSADPQLQQIYNQQMAASSALDGLSPAQRTAAIAQINANSVMAANQAIAQVNTLNQQEASRINNMNTQLYNQFSAIDNNERERYEQKTYQAMFNTERSLENWFAYNNKLRSMNALQQNQANTLASLFPNTTFTPDGRIVSNGINPVVSMPTSIGGGITPTKTKK